MKKMTKAMLMTALILGSVSIDTAVHAEELNTFALDEYVVTATRTLKEIQEVPASVSVITAQDIEKKNATNVREALKGLPGVYIEPTSMSTMSNGIQMRGFTGNNILVLVDGVQVNTAYGGEADLTQVPVENIERIEVLRGAASSIYGGYAVGGVINITTKEAKKIGTTGEAVVSYGSNDTWKKSLQVNSKVNDKWSFGLGYEKSESDGYVSSYIVKTPEDGKGAGSTKKIPNLEKLDNGNYLVGERGKKSWENENYNFNIKYNFDDDKSLRYAYSKTDYNTKYGNPTLYADVSYFSSSGKVNLEEKDGKLYGASVTGRNLMGTMNYFERDTHSLVYNDNDNKFKVQASYVDNKVDGYVQPPTSGGFDLNYDGKGEYTNHPTKVYDLHMEKAWENIGKHTIVVGANYKKEEIDQTVYNLSKWNDRNSLVTSGTVIKNSDKGEVENLAIYVQDEYKISEPLTMYVGARIDHYEKGAGYFNSAGTPTTSPSETYTELSPKVAFDYKADENTNYYVSYGHSFNPPQMYKLYRYRESSKGNTHPNPSLKPETSDTYELGMKKILSDNTNLGVTFYHIDTKDKISEAAEPFFEGSVDKRYINLDEEERNGIELELNHKFSDKYSAYLNYAWQNGDIAAADYDIPKHLLHAGLEYNCDKWNALIECQYVSERNKTGDDFEGLGSQEAIFLVNTAFNYQMTKDMTLQFGINNLFDKVYYCDEPIDERSYYVTMRYNF